MVLEQFDIDAVPTAGVVVLPPAPRSLEALGRNHTLQGAIAELVDNSIDAGAQHVLIRFVQAEGRLVQLVVVDDGCGMGEEAIDNAMTVGGDREYRGGEIGRFGFGLKAASFSQANVMTVLSRTADGESVGRRWRVERAKADFSCEIVEGKFAAKALATEWELPPAESGTMVLWDDVRGFPVVADEAEVDRFLATAIHSIQTHLGLIYHRVLDREAIRIYVDVEDRHEGLGQRVEVRALDPFGYPKSGVPGWPKPLHVRGADHELRLECHIWPGRSQLEQYRLDGDQITRQGIYVYLNDRLIQRGGWNGLVQPDKQLSLARVAVDIGGDMPEFLTVKPEKNGIELGPRFASLVLDAKFDGGLDFAAYVDAARGYLKETNRRKRERVSRRPPGSGFHPRVRKAIEREVPIRGDEEGLSIRWAPLPRDQFFDVDRDDSTLWLNKRFRSALAGGRAGNLNDQPVLKTLLYLLVEEVFQGAHHGPRDKDNIELWQELLRTAAEAELESA